MNATHAMNDSDAAAISAAANRNYVGSDELKPPFTTPIRTSLALTDRFVIQNSVAATMKPNDISAQCFTLDEQSNLVEKNKQTNKKTIYSDTYDRSIPNRHLLIIKMTKAATATKAPDQIPMPISRRFAPAELIETDVVSTLPSISNLAASMPARAKLKKSRKTPMILAVMCGQRDLQNRFHCV